MIAIGTTGAIFGKEIERAQNNEVIKGLEFLDMYAKRKKNSNW